MSATTQVPIDVIADPARVARLNLTAVTPQR